MGIGGRVVKIRKKVLTEQDFWLSWLETPVEVTWAQRVEFHLFDSQGTPLERHPLGYPLNPIAQGKMCYGMHISVVRQMDKIAQKEGYGIRWALEDALDQPERVLVDAFGPEEAAKRIGWAKHFRERNHD